MGRRVRGIDQFADGRRLDFRLRMVPAAKSGLNSNARFWLIGANPNFSDLSSLKAAPAGEYRLRGTGEIVRDPDYLATWIIDQPDA